MATRRRRTASRQATHTCRKCRRRVPTAKMKRATRDRVASVCRACDAERARARYQADLERHREKSRRRYWANVEEYRRRQRAYARSARGRATNNASVRRWRARNPHKVAAALAVHSAIICGRLKRPARCEVLRCTHAPRHSHHNSYDRRHRLQVVHLCGPHHEAVHHRKPLKLKASAAFKFAKRPAAHAALRQRSKHVEPSHAGAREFRRLN